MKTSIPTIRFDAPLYKIKEWTILRLPESASQQLSSRGQAAVKGTINGHEFYAVIEPDGNWGHWLRVTDELQVVANAHAGDTATLEITQTKDWPEPSVPDDVAMALKTAPEKVRDKWQDITPMARWEWIRWIGATANPDTRAIRIEKSISKLGGKHRRPCCFNLAACTEPYVAKSGQLIGIE
jgi:uncharacterized protein YdeI (YjbR/CyaY-like superfamily)